MLREKEEKKRTDLFEVRYSAKLIKEKKTELDASSASWSGYGRGQNKKKSKKIEDNMGAKYFLTTSKFDK